MSRVVLSVCRDALLTVGLWLSYAPASDAEIPATAVIDDQRVGTWNGPAFVWQAVAPAVARRFEIEVPAGHRFVTAVIDTAAGRRVRNLVGMAPVSAHGGDPDRAGPQRLTLPWNGCDDEGKPVPPQSLVLRGLSLPGLDVRFERAWYNPGSPPWEGGLEAGWGPDHSCLSAVACGPRSEAGGWAAVFAGGGGESGHGVWAVDRDGRKKWGFKRHWSGANGVAIRDDEVWLAMSEPPTVMRVQMGTGQPLGFQRRAGVIGELKFAEPLKGIAVGQALAGVLVGARGVVLVERATGRKVAQEELPAATIGIAAFASGGFLCATDAGLQRVDEAGGLSPFVLPGLGSPGPLAVDQRGRIVIFDRGPDRQVKVFEPDGRCVRTIGSRGGRRTLAYDPAALSDPSGLAVDEAGNVWIVEPAHPRRASVWSPEGTLVRDFIGNTPYGAAHCTMHDQDPGRALLFNTVFFSRPDRPATYGIERFLSSGFKPGSPVSAAPPQYFFHRPTFLRSEASGVLRDYVVTMQSGFPVVLVEKPVAGDRGDFRPAVAIAPTRTLLPTASSDGVSIWCDADGDELVQPGECQELGTAREPVTAFYAWSQPFSPRLEFCVQGTLLAPVRFLESGAPVYDVAQARRVPVQESLIRVGRHLVGVRGVGLGVAHYLFVDPDDGIIATYPANWAGLHAAMQSPVPRAGETCGELFWAGTADIGGAVGSVVAAHGNHGQAFVFTEDGLFVGALFRDFRQSPTGFGTECVAGLDWTEATMGQEAFGGWFGRHDDGRVRYMFGRNAALVCTVDGWEAIRRLEPIPFEHGDAVVRSAPAIPAGVPSAAPLTVACRGDRTIAVDGSLADWTGVARRTIVSGTTEVGTIAMLHDGTDLWIAATAADGSAASNGATDVRMAFKHGAAVELDIGPIDPPRTSAAAGDARLLLVPLATGPVAVLTRPVVPGTAPDRRVRYSSPVRETFADDVATLTEAVVRFAPTAGGYACEARVPLAAIGIAVPAGGASWRGDVGLLSPDTSGETTARRSYLFATATSIVSDVPSEAELLPATWGTISFEEN